jgi:hypothetical protein
VTSKPLKSFNIVGTCNPNEHYMVPAAARLPNVSGMIDSKSYFVLHAPRQSGKTTCLFALTNKINAEGQYYALNCSLAPLSGLKDANVAMREIVGQINAGLLSSRVGVLNNLAYAFDDKSFMDYQSSKVRLPLNALSLALEKELVVFFDEADCLNEEPLIRFLAQIRDGYLARADSPATKFPRSLALIGTRKISDYRDKVRPSDESIGDGGPFNITMEPMKLANFTLEEINALYGQRAAETGQTFEPKAVERAWYWTEGQPWLVNALAYHVIVRLFGNDCSKTVTGSDIDKAAQALILREENHFTSLFKRLKEPRVKKVIEPVILDGGRIPNEIAEADKDYVVDIGLLKKDPAEGGPFKPSNPIYGELIVRAMTAKFKEDVPKTLENKWMDGTKLDMNRLLKAFQAYWRENSQIALKSDSTDSAGLANEATAHLVLYAFLQRVMNGGADFIQREYPLGKTKADICVCYKEIRYPLELKIKGALSQKQSLERLSSYMDKCGSSQGWLIVFDKDFTKSWEKKLFRKIYKRDGKTMYVVGC